MQSSYSSSSYKKKYHNNHRMKEFSDVDIYLHQMVYSFIRTPKIHTALSDTYAIADGHLKALLKDALDELEYGMGDNVYYEALEIIEKTITAVVYVHCTIS